MSTDVNQALYDFLTAQLPTWTINASANFMAPGFDPADGTPGLAFKVRSGTTSEESDLYDVAFQLKVYGVDAEDAWANYMALDAALDAPADQYVAWSIQEGLGTPVIEPGSEFHFVMANYRVKIRNI